MTRFILILLAATVRVSMAQLNSPYDEQSPVLNPDGTELYFTISNHPLNTIGKRDPGDVWVSKFMDGKWQAPTLAIGRINNAGYNAVLGFSSDGSEMYLYGHYKSDGSAAGSQGIAVSKKQNGSWSLPVNENIPFFQNKSVASGGYVLPDKSIFIFSADARLGFGNEDILACFNKSGQWTEPINLGSIINSLNQELSPFLSEDTKTIYFSSNGKLSSGSFDIFFAERLDETWTNWSLPKRLEIGINTSGKELFYCNYSGRKFYTTTHDSDGYGDIREIIPEAVVIKKDTSATIETIAPTEIKPQVQVKSGFVIKGKVTDVSTGLGIAADLVFHGSTSTNANSGANGDYRIVLSPEEKYTVRAEANGYIGFFEKIELPTGQQKELEINFKLQPVTVGASVNLRNVLFKQSSPELLPDSYDELDMVLEFLKANPTVAIELSGHTDNSGKSSLNLKLSRDRVTRVKNYLVEKGIDARRIKGVGYGETKPISSNKTEEGKRLNRRVEFSILSVN